jgi:hypothetical protein
MDENNHIDIKDETENVEWDTCCSHSSREFVKYIITVSISMIVLIFCLFMIAVNPNDDNSIYFSLLSSIITLYVPSPQINKSKKPN